MRPTWRHLARRFVSVGTARRLSDVERTWVRHRIPSDDLAELFFAQPPVDQRHAVDGAREVATRRPHRQDLVAAALLHDVGKRHAGFGIVRRSLAGAAQRIGVRAGGRFALYTAHGPVGSDELAGRGAEGIVVEFARHHHGARPESIDPDDWTVLVEADHDH